MATKIQSFKCCDCRYSADGRRGTVVCCYYGYEDTDPYGDCEAFEPSDHEDDEG